MNWSKVQSALIVLFIAINIFLLCIIAYNGISQRTAEKKDLEKTMQILKANNISVPENLPKSPRMPVLSVENAIDVNFAAKVLLGGEDFTVTENGNMKVYKKAEQTLLFSGDFIEYKSGKTADKPLKKEAEKQLSELGFDLGSAKVFLSDTQIVFEGMYDGKKIYSNKLTAELCDGQLSYLRGKWANVLNAAGSKEKISPVQNTFISLLREGAKNVLIENIEAGYEIMLDSENQGYKTAEAVPVWKIEIQNGITHFYDARR